MPAAGTTIWSNGPWTPASMASSWANVPYSSSLALDGQHGHVDAREGTTRCSSRGSRATARRGSIPRTCRRRRRGSGPVVAAARRPVRLPGGLDPGDRAVLHEDVRRQEHQAGDGMAGAGVDAVRSTHRRCGRRAPAARARTGQHRGQHAAAPRRACTTPATAGARATIGRSRAGVDERVGSPVAAPTVVGERAPQLDRAEPLVEEDQRRPSSAATGRVDAVVDRTRADGQVELGSAPQPSSSCARARTAGSCRWRSSAAASTDDHARGAA